METANSPEQKFIYRVWLTKENEAKYLSHHDIAQILEHAIRRSQLPVCLAGRFNPRLKISYFSSVPVGVSSSGEPVNISFTRKISEDFILHSLNNNLPQNTRISRVQAITSKQKYLLEISYIFKIPFKIPANQGETLLQAAAIWVTRTKKYKLKHLDVRPFLKSCAIEDVGRLTVIYLTTLFTHAGTISPWEILELFGITRQQRSSVDIMRALVEIIPVETSPETE